MTSKIKKIIARVWLAIPLAIMLAPALVFAEANQKDRFDADAFVLTMANGTDFEDQEKLVTRELERHPQEIKLYLYLGNMYSNWAKKDPAKYNDAEISYKKALNIDQGSLGAKNGLGSVYFNANQYDKAEREFKEVISADPNFAPVYVNYGLLKARQQQYGEAVKLFKKAISLDPMINEIDFVHLYMGDCYGWLNLQNDAIAEYEKTCEINPRYLQPHLHLGDIYGTEALKTKDLSFVDKARVHYNKALEISPDNEEAKMGLNMLEKAREKIQSNSNIVVKRSGNTMIVVPKEYEQEAETLKKELERQRNSKN
jgi:tetratricopeptide (TPR) repeat protein